MGRLPSRTECRSLRRVGVVLFYRRWRRIARFNRGRSQGNMEYPLLTQHVSTKECKMATFVLVHGAWGGRWGWQWLAPFLSEAGHRVHPITLSGLGERVDLAHPGINPGTFCAQDTPPNPQCGCPVETSTFCASPR